MVIRNTRRGMAGDENTAGTKAEGQLWVEMIPGGKNQHRGFSWLVSE